MPLAPRTAIAPSGRSNQAETIELKIDPFEALAALASAPTGRPGTTPEARCVAGRKSFRGTIGAAGSHVPGATEGDGIHT